MTRVLFWTLLAILVVAAIRSVLRRNGLGDAARGNLAERPGRQVRRAGEAETMLACAHCHIHFPASEAVHADGQDYCSPAHVRLPPL